MEGVSDAGGVEDEGRRAGDRPPPAPGRATAVQVSLLGPVELRTEAGPVSLRRGRQPLLVAALALRPRLVVATRQLVDSLWPAELPRDPDNTLQQLVSQVRRALQADGAALATEPGGYRLDVADGDIDAARFEAELDGARNALAAGDGPGAATLATRALGRWRGPALGGVGAGPLADQAALLEQRRLAAGLVLADARLATGDAAAAVDQLAALVAAHPYDEELWSRYLMALGASGRANEAVHRYEDLCQRLAEDRGLSPGPLLRDLHGRLLREDPALLAAPAAPEPAPARPPPATASASAAERARAAPRLTRPRTTFVGRHEERAAVAERLTRAERLVTIVGPAGSGKTRLALEVAADLQDADRRVTLVRLDAVRGPEGVAAAVAAAAGLTEDGGRDLLEVLAEQLAGRLLVLDNVEHVRGTAAQLCEALLDHSPSLVVLATGRQRLGIPGEQVVRLAPLPIPRTDGLDGLGGFGGFDGDPTDLRANPGVELLLDRAAAVTGSVGWNPEEVAAAARLVEQLDGLPLAIELVAAQAAALTLPQLAATVGSRLGLLEAPPTGRPDRHTRLADAIDWSVDLLDEPQRQLFTACGVFAGAFDVDGAARVAAIDADGALPLLVALVERSLLEPSGGRPDAPAFRMLDTLRAHARRRLARTAALAEHRARLLAHLVELGEASDQGLRGPEQRCWLQRLDVVAADTADLLAYALDEDQREAATRLVAAYGRYWDWRGRLHEADRATAAVLSRIRPLPRTAADAATDATDPADAALVGPPGRGAVLAWRARLDVELGHWQEAEATIDAALVAARAWGDVEAELLSLATAASVARLRGSAADAVVLADDAAALAASRGLDWSVARAATSRGHARIGLGDLDGAAVDAAAAVAGFTASGDDRGLAWALALSALVESRAQRWASAAATAERGLTLAEGLDDQRTCLLLLEVLARGARERGQPDLADSLAEEATRRRHDRGQAHALLDGGGPA